MACQAKNILVNRSHEAAVLEHGGRYLNGRRIDIGCGTRPFERRPARNVAEHLRAPRDGLETPAAAHRRSWAKAA